MRRLTYNVDSQVVRLEYPENWNPFSVDEIDILIADTNGTTLTSSNAVDLYTISQLNDDVSAGDIQIDIISTDRVVPVPGDCLAIAADDYNETEIVTVQHVEDEAGVATLTLTSALLYDHVETADVVSNFATYTLDTTGAEYSANIEVVITWTPVGFTSSPGEAWRELGIVASQRFDVSDGERRFAALYPREYDALTDPVNRYDEMYNEALEELTQELKLRGIDIDRVVDAALLVPTLFAKLRWLVLLSGDDRYRAEREVATQEYTQQFERLATAPVWQDLDSDGKIDDGEEDSSEASQFVGCERGI